MLQMVIQQKKRGEEDDIVLFCTECEDQFEWDEAMEHAEKVHFTTTIMMTGNHDPLEVHSIQVGDA